MYCLSRESTAFNPIPQDAWRDWLSQMEQDNGKSTATAQRKRKVYADFEAIFHPTLYPPPEAESIEWHGHLYASPPETPVLKQIGWELTELGFRADLMFID